MTKLISVLTLLAITTLSGCATMHNDKDPYENFNRSMFSVHEGVDKAVLKPISKGYNYITPDPVKTGVSNFFGNIGDIPNMANNLLQWNLNGFANDLFRVLINTTAGIGGIFDPATSLGLEKSDQDFGLTLAKWGVSNGSYLFLPIIGPGGIRDISGKIVDFTVLNPISYVSAIPARNSLNSGKVIDTRTNMLPVDKIIEEAAFDKYSYIRDSYEKMRYYKINGKPMPTADDISEDTTEDESNK